MHKLRKPDRSRSAVAKVSKVNLGEYLMIAPTGVLFIVFGLLPILYILGYSFTEYNGFSDPKWIGLANYWRCFQDVGWWQTVLNTLEFGLLIPLFQIPLALIIAVILNGKIRGKNFFRVTYFLPNITSSAVMGIIFYFMFATDNGIANAILKAVHLISANIDWFADEWIAKWIIILFRLWFGIGFYMVLFLAALQRLPRDIYESAEMDGANTFVTFTKITLPMLGDLFKIISALSILDAMKLFDSIKAITNGAPAGKTEVMTMYIYRYFFEGGGGGSVISQEGYASAVSIIATIIVAAVALLYMNFTKNEADETGGL